VIDRQSILNVEYQTALEMGRPFMLLRPKMLCEGNKWCALYGDNLQDGVAGFGETPELAAYDFDEHWKAERLPRSGIKAFPDITGWAPKNERYHAIDENTYDGAPDSNSPIGTGPTPEAAIADLKAQLED